MQAFKKAINTSRVTKVLGTQEWDEGTEVKSWNRQCKSTQIVIHCLGNSWRLDETTCQDLSNHGLSIAVQFHLAFDLTSVFVCNCCLNITISWNIVLLIYNSNNKKFIIFVQNLAPQVSYTWDLVNSPGSFWCEGYVLAYCVNSTVIVCPCPKAAALWRHCVQLLKGSCL